MNKTLTREKVKIICSAIRDKDKNIWIGKRHSDCLWLMSKFGVDDLDGEEGFLTNDKKFVNRNEAKKIAVKAKQTIRNLEKHRLFSEDLW